MSSLWMVIDHWITQWWNDAHCQNLDHHGHGCVILSSQSMIIQCITDNVWKCLLYESQSPTEKRRYVWYNVWYWARWGMLWGVWQRYHSHLFSYHIIINAITCTSKCMKIQLNKNSLHIYDTKQCQIDVIYLLLQIWFSLLSSFYMFVHVLE